MFHFVFCFFFQGGALNAVTQKSSLRQAKQVLLPQNAEPVANSDTCRTTATQLVDQEERAPCIALTVARVDTLAKNALLSHNRGRVSVCVRCEMKSLNVFFFFSRSLLSMEKK